MSIEADIADALYAGIAKAVADSDAPNFAIQYPFIDFQVPDDQRWLEVVQIVNNPDNEYWGDSRSYRGIVRLILHWTVDQSGIIPPLRYLDNIAKQIPKGTRFSSGEANVVIYDVPSRGSAVTDEGAVYIPLSLSYRDFKP